MTFADLLAFAGRNPILSLALAGLTVAIVANEVAVLTSTRTPTSNRVQRRAFR